MEDLLVDLAASFATRELQSRWLPSRLATSTLHDMECSDRPEVTRSVELEADAAEVWAAVCEPGGWLADDGDLDVREGGEGRLVEDGVARRAVVESVVDGEHLVYRWWSEDGDGGDTSRVEIRVLPAGPTTLVTVRETHLGARLPMATNCAPDRWPVRLAWLGLRLDLVGAAAAATVVATAR
jgi:uncharacterized protein YndB with AHSA1/START domain